MKPKAVEFDELDEDWVGVLGAGMTKGVICAVARGCYTSNSWITGQMNIELQLQN